VSWRVARSLDVLLAQFNAACPTRSKVSDGAIGDAAHASRNSDHNPWYGPGIVTARDYTHDPASGMDMGRIRDQLLATRDNRIKYVISNGQIASGAGGPAPWVWRPYTGTNAHRHHLHLSVVASPLCDDTRPWSLALFGSSPAAPAPVPPNPGPAGVLRRGSTGAKVTELQRVLARWYPFLNLVADGVYGPATEAAVKELQRRSGLVADGVAGPLTLGRLGIG
jgi:hypothetical protein